MCSASTDLRTSGSPSLTPEERDLLPTAEEVALYRERGWYRTHRVFTDAELDAAIEGTERFYAGDIPKAHSPVPDQHIPRGAPPAGLRKHDYASHLCPALQTLIRKPVLAAIAASLADTDEIRLWHEQLLYKPAEDGAQGSAVVGWHTDRGYWQMCTSENMLTAWIPFHDCDERMGTITMLEGSHRWDMSLPELDFFASNHAAVEERLSAAGHEVRRVPVELRRGEVSFHHVRTIHGSPPNRGDGPRRSLAVHLQDGPNRHRAAVDAAGRPHTHELDTLCRQVDGVPDYTDPLWCPVLWPPTRPAPR